MRYILLIRSHGDGREHGFRLFAREFHTREAAEAAKVFFEGSDGDCECAIVEDPNPFNNVA